MSIHQQYPDLIDWQQRLDEAIRGCLERGMTVGDVAEWVEGTLQDAQDEVMR